MQEWISVQFNEQLIINQTEQNEATRTGWQTIQARSDVHWIDSKLSCNQASLPAFILFLWAPVPETNLSVARNLYVHLLYFILI